MMALPDETGQERHKDHKMLTWTPNSPDPNPIKHAWDMAEQVQSLEAVNSIWLWAIWAWKPDFWGCPVHFEVLPTWIRFVPACPLSA